MTDFLYTDARWTERFVEVNDPHKEGHHVRFYFEPSQRPWQPLNWGDMPVGQENNFDFMEGARWAEKQLKEKNNA